VETTEGVGTPGRRHPVEARLADELDPVGPLDFAALDLVQ
jgi:hypothetical protein